MEQMVCSGRIPAVPGKRKLSEFRSEPLRMGENAQNSVPWDKIEANTWNSNPNLSTEEKTARNSVPWNKNRNKLSEFCSEAVSEENCLLEQDFW